MSGQTTVTVIGAGGKMGMRVSANLAKSEYASFYVETSQNGRARVAEAGRELGNLDELVPTSDFVILAVPDIALGSVSSPEC